MIKTINTGVSELVLVKVPEGMNITVSNTQIEWGNAFSSGGVKLPMGDYELLGIAHELIEEVWSEIVELNPPVNPFDYFKDYSEDGWGFDTATESGMSLLKANGVFLSNPNGDIPPKYDCPAQHIWEKAQQNTGKWVVLKKTNV